MISSNVQTAFAPHVTNRTAKLPKTPTSLEKARGMRMMSSTDSALNAATKSPGISLRKPVSALTAPLNQAIVRGMAFAF